MKNSISFLAIILFTLFSCSSDNAGELHYDGSNFSAPLLIAGQQEVGARFIPAVVSEYDGLSLTEVSYYFQDVPDACRVKIYGRGTDQAPGPELYSGDASSGMRSNSWNNHVLSSPILLESQELWIVLELDLSSDRLTIGCDEGPADSNGDFLLDIVGGGWSTFRTLSRGETSINWNIRGILQE